VRGFLVLRVVAKLLMPFMLLFALYVQFHGDFGPGGGFQAGVIAAAAVVLYALVFGLGNAVKVVPPKVAYVCGAVGVMIYIGTGHVAWLLGGKFLDYSVLAPNAAHGQEYGILSVETGVLITVFGVMVGLFYAFAARRRIDT
jgi:multicomponent Na+:H+ antiporter subunit B